MARLTGPRAAASASVASTASAAASHSERALIRPTAAGLSVRPAAVSRSASRASLDQPTESCPASTASATSATRPAPNPRGAASAVSSVAMAVTARLGMGWLAMTSARTSFIGNRPASTPA